MSNSLSDLSNLSLSEAVSFSFFFLKKDICDFVNKNMFEVKQNVA